ncbi:MAG TPA: GNAT family N-acetyltransferase [Thermomicrobiales bacterium]|jgi:GNAT superfamily N-acetyltransferase|nr:GNAT family N-acetyltransferase [Thermomicrobiales bacterium]
MCVTGPELTPSDVPHSYAQQALHLRAATSDDHGEVIRLLDESVMWLVSRGRSNQWGSEPWTGNETRMSRIYGMLQDNDGIVAERAGRIVGVAVVGQSNPPYVPDVVVPQRYIHLLIAAPSERGNGVGSVLLERIRADTRAAGIRLLRVDSFGGGDRRLVNYYVGQGFTPTETFHRGNWVGQLYEQYLD